MKISRTGILVSALPGLMLLGLFYSLAVHMYRSLGGWPTSIGERGFPPLLVTHVDIAVSTLMVMIPLVALILPIAIVLSLSRQSWRRFTPYLAACAVAFVICCALMLLAPQPYLDWWRG